MCNRIALAVVFLMGFAAGNLALFVYSREAKVKPLTRAAAPADAIAEAQTPKEVPVERPEQKKTAHDLSDIFAPKQALPSSEALVNQTDEGRYLGFDAYHDPLGAMKPGMTFEQLYKAAVAGKAEGHGDPAEAAGEPLQPQTPVRPGGQDVARQATRGRPDRQAAEGHGLGDAGRDEPGGNPSQGRLPVQGASSSGARGRVGRPGLSTDADQDVSAPGAVRCGFRPPGSLPARVPAGHVSAEPARAGRCFPGRGRLDQQLLPPVQGHS